MIHGGLRKKEQIREKREENDEKKKKRENRPRYFLRTKEKILIYYLLVQLMCIMYTALYISIVLRCDFNKFFLSSMQLERFFFHIKYAPQFF